VYARENEARDAQRKMRDLLAEFERMDNADALAGEEAAAAAAKALEDARVTKKNNDMYANALKARTDMPACHRLEPRRTCAVLGFLGSCQVLGAAAP
jgi:capsule polysaccharide export protein KpsE/RkpR